MNSIRSPRLILLLISTALWWMSMPAAAESKSCSLKPGFNFRDAIGNEMNGNSEAGATYKCLDLNPNFTYTKDNKPRTGKFRLVQFSDDSMAWIADSAVVWSSTPTSTQVAAPALPAPAPLEVKTNPDPVVTPVDTAPAVVKVTDNSLLERLHPELVGGTPTQDAGAATGVVETADPHADLPSDQDVAINSGFDASAELTKKPVNLYGSLEQSANDKQVQFMREDTAWVTATSSLHLRDQHDISKVSGTIENGALLQITEIKEINGEKWSLVVPYQCDKVKFKSPDTSSCEGSYWVNTGFTAPTDAPGIPEIQEQIGKNDRLEAAIGCNCDTAPGNDTVTGLRNDAADMLAAASDSGESTYQKYMKVHAQFLKDYPQGNMSDRSYGRSYEWVFLNYLVQKMGAADASKAVMALTAFGEARGAGKTKEQNIGEMAMVMAVINNRADTDYRNRQTKVHCAAADAAGCERLKVATANSQFSVWNKNDPNLSQMMLAGGNDNHLARAFNTMELMEQQKIRPIGALASNQTRHYYSRSMSKPLGWGLTGRTIDAQIETPDGIITIYAHHVMKGVW